MHYQRWWKRGDVQARGLRPIIKTVEGILAECVQDGDCLLWTRACTSAGYAEMFFEGEHGVLVHRWIYERTVGVIPDGLDLDHLCRRRNCVNAEHLEPVTRPENVLRGDGPSARAARQPHCKRGHLFSGVRTVKGRKRRVCGICEPQRAGQ